MIGHVPISLLELNTAAHAICALAIYVLWWEKPFDVESADVTTSDTLWPIHAFEWMWNHSGVYDAVEEQIRSLTAVEPPITSVSTPEEAYYVLKSY